MRAGSDGGEVCWIAGPSGSPLVLVGASEDVVAARALEGAPVAAAGGAGAEVFSARTGPSGVVVGGPVGADGGRAAKEARMVDGSTRESVWTDGEAAAEYAETDVAGGERGVGAGMSAVRVSMLTVLPRSSTQTTTSGTVTVT